MNYTGSDIDIATRTVWGEARGESFLGKRAVFCVFRNRAMKAEKYREATGKLHPLYGEGCVKSACLMPKQASCWNPEDKSNFPFIRFKKTEEFMDDRAYRDCLMAVLNSSVSDEDVTHGATHYYSTKVFKDGDKPSWAVGRTPTCTIGNHVFLDLDNG